MKAEATPRPTGTTSQTPCVVCGADQLVARHGEYVFDWPQGYAVVHSRFPDAAWQQCEACGEQVLPPELLARIERERYRLEGLLTPAEIREVRERAGLPQRDMAKLLGVGDKSYTRWELGLSLQTKSMDNLIRLADRHPELLLELEAQRDPQRHEDVAGYVRGLAARSRSGAVPLAAHGGELDDETARRIRARLHELAGQDSTAEA